MIQPDDLAPFVRKKDDSGHTYYIPAELNADYIDLENRIERAGDHSDKWYDLVGEFEDKFGQYRIGGKEPVVWISKSEILKA